MNNFMPAFSDYNSIWEGARKEAQEQERYIKTLQCTYGKSNYMMFAPFLEKLDKSSNLIWNASPLMKTIYLEKGGIFTMMKNCYTIIFLRSDGSKSPWIRFVIDHNRKMLVPVYFQNDDIGYYAHIVPEKKKCDHAALQMADQSLFLCLAFMKEEGIEPDDLSVCSN